jgi:hypothetical protein
MEAHNVAKKPTLDAVQEATQDAMIIVAGGTADNPLAKMMVPFVRRAIEWQKQEWSKAFPETTADLAQHLFKESANVIA